MKQLKGGECGRSLSWRIPSSNSDLSSLEQRKAALKKVAEELDEAEEIVSVTMTMTIPRQTPPYMCFGIGPLWEAGSGPR